MHGAGRVSGPLRRVCTHALSPWDARTVQSEALGACWHRKPQRRTADNGKGESCAVYGCCFGLGSTWPRHGPPPRRPRVFHCDCHACAVGYRPQACLLCRNAHTGGYHGGIACAQATAHGAGCSCRARARATPRCRIADAHGHGVAHKRPRHARTERSVYCSTLLRYTGVHVVKRTTNRVREVFDNSRFRRVRPAPARAQPTAPPRGQNIVSSHRQEFIDL